MEIIDSVTEQTTAATDAVLGILSLACAVFLYRIGENKRWKANLWVWVFGLLATASFFGAVAHGFKMSKELNTALWYPLNLSLGLLVGFILVGVVYDIWGEVRARRVLPIMALVGVGFFIFTQIFPDSFLVFIIYEALVLIFAMGAYIRLGAKARLAGAWFMVGGILLSIAAAVVQATNLFSFTFIWSFDHNGVFHLIQMVAVLFLFLGLKKSMRTIV